MKQYEVTGMSCAACSARVEKAVSQVPALANACVGWMRGGMAMLPWLTSSMSNSSLAPSSSSISSSSCWW